MEKHIHADLIIAWANGATIEYRSDRTNEWLVTTNPSWNNDSEYRVKPFPTTSFTGEELHTLFYAEPDLATEAFVRLANAAIKRHIDETTNG